jgi:hypothetical protein
MTATTDLLEFTVHGAHKVQGHRQLKEQSVHEHQVTNGHGTCCYVIRGQHHHPCQAHAEDGGLPEVEE